MTLNQKTLLFLMFFFAGCQTVKFPWSEKSNKKGVTTYKSRTNTASNKRKTKPSKANKYSYLDVNSAKKQIELRDRIIKQAKKYKGISYTYGGKKPSSGFDCSGFSTFVFAKEGINISGSSKTMSRMGNPKASHQVEIGDLAFFGSNGKVTHVAIVLSKTEFEFQVIHSTSSKGVITTDIQNSNYWKGRYLFSRDVISNYNYGITGLD